MTDHEILQRFGYFDTAPGDRVNDAHDLKPSGVSRADDAQGPAAGARKPTYSP